MRELDLCRAAIAAKRLAAAVRDGRVAYLPGAEPSRRVGDDGGAGKEEARGMAVPRAQERVLSQRASRV